MRAPPGGRGAGIARERLTTALLALGSYSSLSTSCGFLSVLVIVRAYPMREPRQCRPGHERVSGETAAPGARLRCPSIRITNLIVPWVIASQKDCVVGVLVVINPALQGFDVCPCTKTAPAGKGRGAARTVMCSLWFFARFQYSPALFWRGLAAWVCALPSAPERRFAENSPLGLTGSRLLFSIN